MVDRCMRTDSSRCDPSHITLDVRPWVLRLGAQLEESFLTHLSTIRFSLHTIHWRVLLVLTHTRPGSVQLSLRHAPVGPPRWGPQTCSTVLPCWVAPVRPAPDRTDSQCCGTAEAGPTLTSSVVAATRASPNFVFETNGQNNLTVYRFHD